MVEETDNPIERRNVYYDTETDLYVVVGSMFVDIDGNTQIRIRQYSDTPIAAHTAVRPESGFDRKRLLSKEDVRSRVLSGELQFQFKD